MSIYKNLSHLIIIIPPSFQLNPRKQDPGLWPEPWVFWFSSFSGPGPDQPEMKLSITVHHPLQ